MAEKVTKSTNTKGNPFHDEEGKFTEADGVGSASEEKESESFGVVELKEVPTEKPRLNIAPGAIEAFLNAKKEKKIAEANEFISKHGSININFYNSLDDAEIGNLIAESDQGYQKNLTLEEKKALLCAEDIVNKKNHIANEINVLEKEKEDLHTQMATEIANHKENEETFSGIWFLDSVTPYDYEAKSQKDELGKSSIDKKKEYYNEILSNPSESLENKAKATQSLKKLAKFEEKGKAFKEIVDTIKASYTDKFEAIESKQVELNKEKENYNENSPVYIEANRFIESRQDKNAAYSKHRKDNAVWIDSKWINAHPEFKGGGIYGAAKKYFGEKFEKIWQNSLNSGQRSLLMDYTGNGFSKYNKPLRGKEHGGWKGFDFAEKVTTLTDAIDKCIWDEDIWTQRGVNAKDMIFKLPGGLESTIDKLSDKDLQSLVGTSFCDKGFYSSGAGKNTGFWDRNLVINTYCPKGTKMAYMGTHGNFQSENEMILQRGYSYRITKVEHKGNQYYMDVEVILGSDKNNITDKKELAEIGKKYLI